MRRRLLDLLVCPVCHGQVLCTPNEMHAEEIVSGTLTCTACGRVYPVRRGIPRMLASDSLDEDKARTASAFGWEWQRFRELHDLARYRDQFLDWISPLGPAMFRDKVVLDAGCGMGRFAIVSAEFGARDVIAIDLSDAVEAAQINVQNYPNVHVVQADIYHLPLRTRTDSNAVADIDFAYSIGVLHHLPDPEGGFRAIRRHLRPNGALFAWVYGRENNGWLVHVVNPVRESISSRLPRGALYALSFALTALLQLPLKIFYGKLGRRYIPESIAQNLPYRAYLRWLATFGFKHNHHVVFDHLVAPTAFYVRRTEFAAWFERAGLGNVQISARNDNSWRGYGECVAENTMLPVPQMAG